MKRPPAALRVGIVVAALALLGLAMCNRSKPAANEPAPVQQPQQPPATQQQEAPADAPAVEEEGPGQGKMGKEPQHFPATKAPGRLY
jgi:hypothetical protein